MQHFRIPGHACILVLSLLPLTRVDAQDCKTTLVSVDTGGGSLGWGGVGGGRISSDGSRIIFTVMESPYPNSPIHAYVRDEVTGITTRLPGPYADDISGDGRWAVWDGAGIFVTDLQTGTTARVDVDSSGQPANGMSLWGRISEDGRCVAFMSTSSNLVPGDTNGREDIFVRDLQAGTTERVSVSSSGVEGNSTSWSFPVISADGRYVAFASLATNLAPGDSNGDWNAYLHDRVTGSTQLVSQTPSGRTGNAGSGVDAISGDGRFVSFDSMANDFVPGDTNGQGDVFVRDTLLGTTVRISTSANGGELNAPSWAGAMSYDGRLVLFSTVATRVVPGDTNPGSDVFVRDLVAGSVELVSRNSLGEQGWGSFYAVDMSPDGRFVSFRGDSLPPPTSGWGIHVRGCPQAVTRYGESKRNSLSCKPWIHWTGTPSSSAGSGFVVRAEGLLNRRVGRLVYGLHFEPFPPIPYLVIAPPFRRLPLARTGGSISGSDCTGSLEVDLNDWIAHGGDPALVPGTTVYGQFWTTDDGFAPPDDYGLSDAIDFTIQP